MTRRLLLLTALMLSANQALAQAPTGPEIRNIDANFTTNTIVADGVISPGEWDGAAAGGGDFRILREPAGALDQDGHQFSILWDNDNLYLLLENNFSAFEPVIFGGNPAIDFAFENYNLYFDPNRDGDLNQIFGEPLDVANGQTTDNVDGYQIAFSTPEGNFISTDADRQGVGFFTEAHVDTPFGDAGNWNQGGNAGNGPALANGIVVGQTNSDTEGGLVELVIPFSAFNADELVSTPAPTADFNGDGNQDNADYTIWRDTFGDEVGGAGNGMLDGADANDDGIIDEADYDTWRAGFGRSETELIESGLNAVDGPTAGDIWGFQAGFIGDAGPNLLPVWNFSDTFFFATGPHGTLTFLGGPSLEATATPEPGALAMLLSGFMLAAVRRRRS